MSVRYEDNNKIIEAEDTHTGLVDAIANVMLLVGGNEDLLEAAIEQAKGSAEIHYDAEKNGESEGMPIFVDPQDSSERVTLVPLREWVAAQDQGKRYTVAPFGQVWEVLDGGASYEDGRLLYKTRLQAQCEADQLNATN